MNNESKKQTWESKGREHSLGRAFPCSLQAYINFLYIVGELDVPRILRDSCYYNAYANNNNNKNIVHKFKWEIRKLE